MKSIALPTLAYPFVSAINIRAEAVNKGTIAWACRYDLMPRAPAEKRRHEEYGHIAARVYPNAPAEALQVASDFVAWLFFADDQNDETDVGCRLSWMKELHARFGAVLEGHGPTSQDRPLCHALHDLVSRASRRAPAGWMGRFSRSMLEYFAASRWECENRRLSVVPSPATYLAMRPFTGAVYACFDLFAVTDALHLPAAVHDHPVVQALRLRANNVIGVCNDILSVEKELSHGDVHNLVLAIRHDQRCTLQEAIHRAAAWHDAEVGAYLALEPCMPSFGSAVDADLARYAGGLRAWMRGNLDWSLASARYRSSASQEDDSEPCSSPPSFCTMKRAAPASRRLEMNGRLSSCSEDRAKPARQADRSGGSSSA